VCTVQPEHSHRQAKQALIHKKETKAYQKRTTHIPKTVLFETVTIFQFFDIHCKHTRKVHENVRNSFASGGSQWKYSGKPGSSQCYHHITDRVLWIHRMLVTKRDLLFPQLLRLPSRLLGLVLPLHPCFSNHFV